MSPQSSSHYIEFEHVYKTFDRPVLADVSFHVSAGETLAIIGRSGVGKSVTLQHIMGFLKPDTGRVHVAYSDITGMTESELRRIRKKVTMVFQSGALFDSLTVGENILFSLELREDYNEKNKEDVVHGLLHMVDLGEYKDAYPSRPLDRSSTRGRHRRALAAQPECILYDEPTTMVDPIMSDHIASLMLRLKTQLQSDGCRRHPRSGADAQGSGQGRGPASREAHLFRSYGGPGEVRSPAHPGVPGDGSRLARLGVR